MLRLSVHTVQYNEYTLVYGYTVHFTMCSWNAAIFKQFLIRRLFLEMSCFALISARSACLRAEQIRALDSSSFSSFPYSLVLVCDWKCTLASPALCRALRSGRSDLSSSIVSSLLSSTAASHCIALHRISSHRFPVAVSLYFLSVSKSVRSLTVLYTYTRTCLCTLVYILSYALHWM